MDSKAIPPHDVRDERESIDKLRAELKQVEIRFASFIDSESESIFCYEPDAPVPVSLPAHQVATLFTESRLVVANPTFARMRGETDPRVFYGRSMAELARETLPRIVGLIQHLIQGDNKRDGVEVRQAQPDGSVRYAMSNAHLVQLDGHYTRLWVILRDITEQKRLQAEHEALQLQFRQSQRMESLGLLAGGIAHDFNNLLVVIENCAQFAGEDMERNPTEARTSLRHMKDASTKAAALVRSLMAFARPKTGVAKPLLIDDLITELLTLLRRLIPGRIELNSQLHSGAAMEADPGQLEQVLVNLVINAVDAIADTGEITLTTRICTLNELQRAAHPWVQHNDFVNISVCDTGPGVTPEVSSRIFEPFFTTKTEAKGSGLGLSVVWGAVKLHGGFVEVTDRNDKNSGACFQVFLPRSSGVVQPTKAPNPVGEVWLGTETILVADDHELVLGVTKSLLERAGYRVLVARDGQEALDVFEANKDSINLVLLDAIMPKITGFTAYQKIQAAKPGVGIIVASGHTSDVFPEEWLQATKPVMLSKPFRSEELLKSIRSVLSQGSS